MSIQQHFLNLYGIAISDAHASKAEIDFLYEIGQKNNVPKGDIDFIIQNPHTVPYAVPASDEDALDQIYDFCKMILVDEVIDIREAQYFHSITATMQFESDKSQRVLHFMIDQIRETKNSKDTVVKGCLEVLQTKPSAIKISERGRIHFTDYAVDLNLTPLCRALYILFLRCENIPFTRMSDLREDLISIYQKTTKSDDLDKIRQRIERVIDPLNGGGFSENKTRINKCLTDKLNKDVLEFYKIQGKPGEPFYVKLPREFVDFPRTWEKAD